MTREEFEARMGNTVTEEAWENIVQLYINATDIADWDTFCDDYKLHGTSKILTCLWGRLQLKQQLEKINEDKMRSAAEVLVAIDGSQGGEAYDEAIALMGQAYIVAHKVGQDIPLNDRDKDYVIEHLR